MTPREFALDAVAGAAGASAVRVAALDHEAQDDPVEDEAIIEAAVGQGDEVLHALGRHFGVQLQLDDAAVLHGDGDDGVGLVHVRFLLGFFALFGRGRFRLLLRRRGGLGGFLCGGCRGLPLGAGQGAQQQRRQQQHDDLLHSILSLFDEI